MDTAQPIQQTPATKQGDKYDGVVVKEAVIKQVDTVQQPIQQVPVTQQPRKAIACSQERQVQLSMDTNSILLSSLTDMSCDVLDLPQKEVVIKQVDIAYGMKDDVPDRLHNKVAIQLAPLLQQSPQPHLPLKQNRQAPSATDVSQELVMVESPLPQLPATLQEQNRHVPNTSLGHNYSVVDQGQASSAVSPTASSPRAKSPGPLCWGW